MSVVMVFDLFL